MLEYGRNRECHGQNFLHGKYKLTLLAWLYRWVTGIRQARGPTTPFWGRGTVPKQQWCTVAEPLAPHICCFALLYQSDAVLCLAEHGKGSSGRKPNQITVPLSLKDEPKDWSDRENKQPNNPWLPQLPRVTADGRTEEPVSQEGRIKLNSFFFFPSQL